jgi:hypothetical protein
MGHGLDLTTKGELGDIARAIQWASKDFHTAP